MGKYTVIDLFAGAGGLSLGFMQTQKYEIKVAFENNPDMQKTYVQNHPKVKMFGNVCDANYQDIQNRFGEIDVVIGGPPCQGFSNANRQKNHAISKNNMLVKQYIRAITELQPKAFVMENVGMLRSEVHRFYMEKKDEQMVANYKIPLKDSHLVLLEEEFFFPEALEIVRSETQIEHYLWNEAHYKELNIIYKATKSGEKLMETLKHHKEKLLKIAKEHEDMEEGDHILMQNVVAFSAIRGYFDSAVKASELKDRIAPAIMIQRMLSKAKEIFENDLIIDQYATEHGLIVTVKSFAVYDYINAVLVAEGNDYVLTNAVLCAADYGAPQKRMRFVIMGIKKGISSKVAFPKGSFDEDEYRTVRDAIEDLEDCAPVYDLVDDIGIHLEQKPVSELAASLRNSINLKNHITTKTTETALKRFQALKQGQNFHSLDDSLKTNTYTDVSRTQKTIYLRLNYDEPCGTVVNVRKSMWIHPTLDRAVSIREAARLQTFPDSFVFCGSKDKQYQQVGNAVPPIMAKSIAKKLAKLLEQENKQSPES